MKNYISYSECHALLFCRITTKPSDEIVDSTTEDGGNCCSRNICVTLLDYTASHLRNLLSFNVIQVMLTASSQHNLYDIYLLLCVQCWTPDDGQRNCPKHEESYSKNKFEILVHLVSFIIRTHSVKCYLKIRNFHPRKHVA